MERGEKKAEKKGNEGRRVKTRGRGGNDGERGSGTKG